jgi:hypothetical protein
MRRHVIATFGVAARVVTLASRSAARPAIARRAVFKTPSELRVASEDSRACCEPGFS